MAFPLRAGVIGSGVFGGYHSQKYADSGRAKLMSIYDIDLRAALPLAEKHGVDAYNDLDKFLATVDIVTVASPASTHFENAYSAIEAGKSVLIEKPIATRIEDARLLIDKASQQNIVLAVGHQERLVFEAMGVYDIPETPTHIEARRMGRWSGRGIDVSVTLDLLIHDADLVISIFDETGASDVKAQATNGMSTRPDDIVVNAEFPSGQTTRLSASRIADKFERFMRIEYPSGTVEIDFIARTLKNTTPFELDANVTETIIGKDPLAANVERFIDAVLGHPDGPAVCGPSGLRALTFALQADHAAGY